MKKHVLITIVASMLSCSLLLAEDALTQQIQPEMSRYSKMTCCKMKNCKSISDRAEKMAAMLKTKAQKYTQLADLCTKCADAQQKVADAAKAAKACDCMGICKDNKDSAEAVDMTKQKQCEELCGKLTAAQEEAKQAFKSLADSKRVERKMKKYSTKCIVPSSVSTESSIINPKSEN